VSDPLSLAIPWWIGATSTGDGDGHRWEEWRVLLAYWLIVR